MIKSVFLLVCLMCIVYGAPQGAPKQQPSEKPEPYSYKYEVKDEEKQLFHDKNESGDADGKVIGQYRVWLPDNRLMIVDYTADDTTGFVPKITFEENANPLQG